MLKCTMPDPALIDQLEPFHQDAFSWAAACCGGDAGAGAEALQEAYVKVAAGRAAFGGRSALKTWWLGVVRITALEQLRRGKRWRRAADDFLDWIGSLTPDERTADDEIVVPDAAWLEAALKQLPARQQEVLQLVFQHQLSLSEAAVVMGVSVGSARTHYDRAKKKLRNLASATVPTLFCDHVT